MRKPSGEPRGTGWLLIVWLTLVLLGVYQAASARDVHIEARGNPYAEIDVKTGKTSKLRPLHSDSNVTLWCEARKGNTSLKIGHASFVRKSDGETLEAVYDEARLKAFHNFGLASVHAAGNYTCKIRTAGGAEVDGNQQIFVRPVAFAGEMDRLDEVDKDNPFRFEGSWAVGVRGRAVNLSCPVIAFPAPTFTWSKNNKEISNPDGRIRFFPVEGIVEVSDIVDEDVGIYECKAKNEYRTDKGSVSATLVVSRRLRVKSELAWLWPLLVIIVILILLAAIIIFCECRKKRNEQKLLEGENDE